MAGCDALVAPTKYEAYGLAVHEALCCGLPAFVSADAGVAERYPAELNELLLSDPSSVRELVSKLRNWRSHASTVKAQMRAFATELRTRTWDDMAEQLCVLCEAAL